MFDNQNVMVDVSALEDNSTDIDENSETLNHPDKHKFYYLYKITNLVNGKIYIGQTYNPKQRWSQYKHEAKKDRDDQLIVRAMIKNRTPGYTNFTFEVIATARSIADINWAEAYVIAQEKSQDQAIGYNIDPGGDNSTRAPEVGAKISAALKEHYANNPSKLIGYKHTEEAKANMSKASMGKPGTNNGKTFDDDWRQNISKGNSGAERPNGRRFTEKQEKEICRKYTEDKIGTTTLAKQYDCYTSSIIEIMNRHGVKRRTKAKSNGKNIFTKEKELEICDAFKTNKFTRKELAEKFKCGTTTIRDVLLRNNVDLKKK